MFSRITSKENVVSQLEKGREKSFEQSSKVVNLKVMDKED